MLTLLTAQLNKTEVNETKRIFWLAIAEVVIFDAPMVVMLYVIWRGV